jgi:hypothetical protein
MEGRLDVALARIPEDQRQRAALAQRQVGDETVPLRQDSGNRGGVGEGRRQARHAGGAATQGKNATQSGEVMTFLAREAARPLLQPAEAAGMQWRESGMLDSFTP